MFHILIDGYNFLHAARDTGHDWIRLPLEDARAAIVNFLVTHRRPGRENITVVFDGSGVAGTVRDARTHGVEILFSEAGVTADEVICRIVAAAPNPRGFLVVTADRKIRDAVSAVGAKIVSPANFILRSEEEQEKRDKAPPREPREKFTGTPPSQLAHWRKVLGFDPDQPESPDEPDEPDLHHGPDEPEEQGGPGEQGGRSGGGGRRGGRGGRRKGPRGRKGGS